MPDPNDEKLAQVTDDLAEAVESVHGLLEAMGDKLDKASQSVGEIDHIKETLEKVSDQLVKVFTGDNSLLMRVILLEKRAEEKIQIIKGRYGLFVAIVSGVAAVLGAVLAMYLKK